MSLDVYLTSEIPVLVKSSGIFIREKGSTKELSVEEWNNRFPDRTAAIVETESETNTIYHANITHNLGQMARACGIYEPVWRPDENGITKAKQLIKPLTIAVEDLKASPHHFKKFNPENGWGSYEGLVEFLENYLAACKESPDARIEVSR